MTTDQAICAACGAPTDRLNYYDSRELERVTNKGRARGFILHRVKPLALRGESIGTSKLTAQQVIEARRYLACGMKHADIARRFGVEKSTISKIATGKNWAHLKKEKP